MYLELLKLPTKPAADIYQVMLHDSHDERGEEFQVKSEGFKPGLAWRKGGVDLQGVGAEGPCGQVVKGVLGCEDSQGVS